MFNFGTNVIVLASSLTKNKSGPRIGSVGFTSGVRKLPPPVYTNKMLLFPQRIIFTNFGFETKLRVEEKIVVGILPIPIVNKNYNDEVNKLFIKISNNYLQHEKWKKIVKNVYNWKCKPICFVVPNANSKQIINKNDTMFIAWLEAVLKSNQIRDMLSNILFKEYNILKKKFKLNIPIIELLLRIPSFNNIKKVNKEISILLKTCKKDTMQIIRWANTINIQHNVNIEMEKLKNVLIPKNGTKFNKEHAVKIISRFMFTPLFRMLCIYSESTKRKEVIEFMGNMDTVKAKSENLLLNLKR
ncbi:MAG: hypothetical protein U9Q27_03490 [Patescibacteria group bacterium]|nr:hypothetical protein [Patescibacteria group bacterium]